VNWLPSPSVEGFGLNWLVLQLNNMFVKWVSTACGLYWVSAIDGKEPC